MRREPAGFRTNVPTVFLQGMFYRISQHDGISICLKKIENRIPTEYRTEKFTGTACVSDMETDVGAGSSYTVEPQKANGHHLLRTMYTTCGRLSQLLFTILSAFLH